MEDILLHGVDKSNTTVPRNILIQSEAGGGKSTLCERLAYLWAKNSAEVQRLNSFNLVFLVKGNLIKLDDKSIYDYICRELLSDVDNICDVIKNLRMLFIVDGYDEISGNKNFVTDLLAKHVCPQSTVILTTRYGQTPPLKCFSNGFGISCLSAADINNFLNKLSKFTSTTSTQLNIDIRSLKPILSTPLFLWFYCLLGKDTFQCVSNRTGLFGSIVDGITQKAVQRLGASYDACSQAVAELEQVAYQCMCNDKLHFSGPLGDLATNIGLVKQTQSHSKLKPHITYTFTHKSLAEYLTACFIAKNVSNKFSNILRISTRTMTSFSCKIRSLGYSAVYMCVTNCEAYING